MKLFTQSIFINTAATVAISCLLNIHPCIAQWSIPTPKDAQDALNNAVEEGKEKAKEAKDAVKNAGEEVQETVEEAVDSMTGGNSQNNNNSNNNSGNNNAFPSPAEMAEQAQQTQKDAENAIKEGQQVVEDMAKPVIKEGQEAINNPGKWANEKAREQAQQAEEGLQKVKEQIESDNPQKESLREFKKAVRDGANLENLDSNSTKKTLEGIWNDREKLGGALLDDAEETIMKGPNAPWIQKGYVKPTKEFIESTAPTPENNETLMKGLRKAPGLTKKYIVDPALDEGKKVGDFVQDQGESAAKWGNDQANNAAEEGKKTKEWAENQAKSDLKEMQEQIKPSTENQYFPAPNQRLELFPGRKPGSVGGVSPINPIPLPSGQMSDRKPSKVQVDVDRLMDRAAEKFNNNDSNTTINNNVVESSRNATRDTRNSATREAERANEVRSRTTSQTNRPKARTSVSNSPFVRTDNKIKPVYRTNSFRRPTSTSPNSNLQRSGGRTTSTGGFRRPTGSTSNNTGLKRPSR